MDFVMKMATTLPAQSSKAIHLLSVARKQSFYAAEDKWHWLLKGQKLDNDAIGCC